MNVLCRTALICLVLAGISTGWVFAQNRAANPHVVETDPLEPAEQLKRFHVPPGFEVQLVAAEPDVQKPINLAFDHRGRLYVTQSVEYPFPAETPQGRDAVKRLSQIGPDGRAGKVETFVDGLNIPIGLVPLRDGAIVYSIPNLYRCWDEDGDGRCERREVLYREFGYRDTHGMCNALRRWVDGWIYACHGFSNTTTLSGSDGQAITMQSGNTFRFRTDGSHVEQFTHGQVNPFGLAFDSLGNIYSADCHSKPLYMLLRGAWYPSFGKPHDGLGFAPVMCRHNHGSTGIAGVVYYAADQFPAEYRDTVFIGNPITNRINHDRLEQHGSSYTAVEMPDFLTCDDRWFRPVDVCLGPDGALYIADFYNRIIGHYEVPLTHPGRDRHRGRIWRVVYKGTPEKPVAVPTLPDLGQMEAAALAELLDAKNLIVRIQAVHELVDRFGPNAADTVKPLVAGAGSAQQRAFGLWVLNRIGQLDDGLLSRLANDASPLVRVHAMKALAERSGWDTNSSYAEIARRRLSDSDAFVRRAAADALALHPTAENIEPLMALWQESPSDDTHLIHAVRMALRNQLLEKRMIAQAREGLDYRSDAAAQLVDVCLGAATPDAAALVVAWLVENDQPRRLADFVHFAARHAADADRQALYKLLAERRSWRKADVVLALGRAAQERGEKPAKEVQTAARRLAARLLDQPAEAQVRDGLEVARQFRLAELHDKISRHAAAGAPHAALRSAALDACAAADAQAAIPLASELLNSAQEPFAVRQKAAQVLAGLSAPAAREALLAALRTAPQRVSVEIAAGLASTKPGAESLLEAMEAGKASPLLLTELVVALRLDANQPARFAQRRDKLLQGLPPRDQRLRQAIDQRREGFVKFQPNPAAGQQVFLKTCAACHKLGEAGNKIGPELDGIGNRGLDRLLEDLLDPSRNVDQAFRSTLLVTNDGRSLVGLVLREEGQVLVMADAQGKELRIPLAEIAERSVSPLSPMPANLLDVLSEEDFYHLLAFLLQQSQRPAGE